METGRSRKYAEITVICRFSWVIRPWVINSEKKNCFLICPAKAGEGTKIQAHTVYQIKKWEVKEKEFQIPKWKRPKRKKRDFCPKRKIFWILILKCFTCPSSLEIFEKNKTFWLKKDCPILYINSRKEKAFVYILLVPMSIKQQEKRRRGGDYTFHVMVNTKWFSKQFSKTKKASTKFQFWQLKEKS